MQQIQVKIDFKDIEPFTDSDLSLNTISEWAKNPNYANLLKRWVCTYYASDRQEYYENMIEYAILANNLLGLEILWQGIYYHDRDHADYDNNLLISLSANLKTLKHVLYAKLNYSQFDYVPFDPVLLKKEIDSMFDDDEIPEAKEYVDSLILVN